MEEISERFLVIGELPDQGVGIEPKQLAFLVVILPAAPVRPVRAAASQDTRSYGGIIGGSP